MIQTASTVDGETPTGEYYLGDRSPSIIVPISKLPVNRRSGVVNVLPHVLNYIPICNQRRLNVSKTGRSTTIDDKMDNLTTVYIE